jgi:hypothetical protein
MSSSHPSMNGADLNMSASVDAVRSLRSSGGPPFGDSRIPSPSVSRYPASSRSRPALADYLLIFKKPGPTVPVLTDVTNDEWIEWAQPVWWNIRETNTLNAKVARESADERHICPLQLDFIERVVRLYSNKGEVVFTPFAGIGSEVYMAAKLGRRGLGIELKPSYWRSAVTNLRDLQREIAEPTLFMEA